jgi:hypothetical protein
MRSMDALGPIEKLSGSPEDDAQLREMVADCNALIDRYNAASRSAVPGSRGRPPKPSTVQALYLQIVNYKKKIEKIRMGLLTQTQKAGASRPFAFWAFSRKVPGPRPGSAQFSLQSIIISAITHVKQYQQFPVWHLKWEQVCVFEKAGIPRRSEPFERVAGKAPEERTVPRSPTLSDTSPVGGVLFINNRSLLRSSCRGVVAQY